MTVLTDHSTIWKSPTERWRERIHIGVGCFGFFMLVLLPTAAIDLLIVMGAAWLLSPIMLNAAMTLIVLIGVGLMGVLLAIPVFNLVMVFLEALPLPKAIARWFDTLDVKQCPCCSAKTLYVRQFSRNEPTLYECESCHVHLAEFPDQWKKVSDADWPDFAPVIARKCSDCAFIFAGRENSDCPQCGKDVSEPYATV